MDIMRCEECGGINWSDTYREGTRPGTMVIRCSCGKGRIIHKSEWPAYLKAIVNVSILTFATNELPGRPPAKHAEPTGTPQDWSWLEMSKAPTKPVDVTPPCLPSPSKPLEQSPKKWWQGNSMNWFRRLFSKTSKPTSHGNQGTTTKLRCHALRAEPERLREAARKLNTSNEPSSSYQAPVGLMAEILVEQMSPMEKEMKWLARDTPEALRQALQRDLRGRQSFFQ